MIKQRLKRLFTAMIVLMLALTPTVFAFAGNGLTDKRIQAGYSIRPADGTLPAAYASIKKLDTDRNRLNMYSGDTLTPTVTDNVIELPVISYDYGAYVTTENMPDLTAYQNCIAKWSTICNAEGNLIDDNPTTGTDPLSHYIDAIHALAPNIDFTSMQTELQNNTRLYITRLNNADVQAQLSNYSVSLDVKMFREGYSIASYALKDIVHHTNNTLGIDIAEYIYQPIWISDGSFYGTCDELNVGDFIEPGSIIYSTDSEIPCFFVKHDAYIELLGDNIEDTNPYITATINNLPGRSYDFLKKFSNHQVLKLKGTSEEQPVIYWKIKNKCSTNTWNYSFTGSYAPIVVSDDNGATKTYYNFTDSPYMTNSLSVQFYELEPVTHDAILLTPPNAYMDGYELKLTTNPPSSQLGMTDYSDQLNNIKNYFYVTDSTVSNVTKSDDFICYNETKDYVLHEGSYKIWKYSSHTASDGTVTESDLNSTVMAVKPPVLTAPTIIEPAANTIGATVNYTINGITSENNLTDYSRYESDQTIQHCKTTDKQFDDTTIDTLLTTDNVTDTLSSGYNKMFCRSALTIPKSVLNEPAVTYYSDIVSQTFYASYELETPVITETNSTIELRTSNNSPADTMQTFKIPLMQPVSPH